jgi:hypothetical protein
VQSSERQIDLADPKTQLVLVGAAVVFVLGAQIMGFHDLRFDDAYVTYRYGQNLATGNGFVFNPGERLLGTTSPLLALISALVYWMTGLDRTLDVMSALGCVAWTAQAALLFAVLRQKMGLVAATLAASMVGAGLLGSAVFVGLETNFVTAAILAAYVCATRDRWNAVAILLAIAALLRPDATLATLPFAVWGYRVRRTAIVRAVGAYALVLSPWIVFSTWYFGSPLPRTLGAKFGQTTFATYASHALRWLPGAFFGGSQAPIVVVLTLWPIAIYGVVIAWRRDPRLCALFAWGGLHLLAYLVIRPDTLFSWHLYPAVFAFATATLIATSTILARLPRMAVVALVVLLTAPIALRTIRLSVSHPTDEWLGARDAAYREVAALLKRTGAPGDLVDAEEVGTLAYFSGLRMTDHPGLVSRNNRAYGHSFVVDGQPTHLRFLVMGPRALPGHAFLWTGKPIARIERHRVVYFVADLKP